MKIRRKKEETNEFSVQKQNRQSVNNLLKGGCHGARSRSEIHVTSGGRDASPEDEGGGVPSGRRVRTSRRRSAVSGRWPAAAVKDHKNFYRLPCKLSGCSNIRTVLDVLGHIVREQINLSSWSGLLVKFGPTDRKIGRKIVL